MKLYAQVLESVVVQLSWDGLPKQEPNWYEIEREPDLLTECLHYDPDKDIVTIEPRIKTAEEVAVEQKAAEDAALMKADTIRDLQAKVSELEKRIASLEKA